MEHDLYLLLSQTHHHELIASIEFLHDDPEILGDVTGKSGNSCGAASLGVVVGDGWK